MFTWTDNNSSTVSELTGRLVSLRCVLHLSTVHETNNWQAWKKKLPKAFYEFMNELLAVCRSVMSNRMVIYVFSWTNDKIIVKAMHAFIIFTQDKRRTEHIVTEATMCSPTVYDHIWFESKRSSSLQRCQTFLFFSLLLGNHCCCP